MGSRFRGNDIFSEWHKVFMAAKRPPALDRIDVKILAALQRDGRSTIQKLAHTVGLSPRASLERVRRLEASGVIAGYQAVVELGRLARPVNVFAEIILERQANRGGQPYRVMDIPGWLSLDKLAVAILEATQSLVHFSTYVLLMYTERAGGGSRGEVRDAGTKWQH